MKKKLVMVMLLLLATVMILSACGDKATEGLEYTARNGGYYVTGYHGTDVNVVIPDTYNDVPVTGIAEEAFAESDIQTVEVGGNVEIIEQAAFYRASLLREVHLPASLRILSEGSVVKGAFSQCVSLETVTFEKDCKLEEIGASAFAWCENLKKIDIPSNVREIGESAFFHCDSLIAVTLPKDALVGWRAFEGCPVEITYK